MKKLILCVSAVLLFAGPALAQKKASPVVDSVGLWVEQLAAQREAERLKSYYIDRVTANACEAWYSCAMWAFHEYEQNQSFKITKAQLKTQRKVYRHRVLQETHLFVEATYAHRTVRLEFITSKASGRQRPYRYIGKFPEN